MSFQLFSCFASGLQLSSMDFLRLQENFTMVESSQVTLYNCSYQILFHLVTYLATWSTSIVLFIATCRLWGIYCEKGKDPLCGLPLPPGHMGVPFAGETIQWILQGVNFYRKRRQKFGNVYKTHVLGRPTIRVIGASNVRQVLMGEHTLVSTSWPTSVRNILGKNALALSHGALHKRRRRAVMRTFSHDSLAAYVTPVTDIIQETLQTWCQRRQIHGYPECRNLTFSVTAKVLLGFRFRPSEVMQLMSSFEILAANIFSVPFNIPGFGLNKGMKARQTIMDLLERCIVQKKMDRGSHQPSTDLPPDVLSVLLNPGEDGNELTHQEMKEAALELLFAGHGTTASAACSLLLQLGKNPKVTEKLSAELFRHGLLSDNDALTFDDLKNLPYTNMVVREVLRLTPPVMGGFRTALKTFEINGYQVPKGWAVAYSIRDTHETSSIFHDHEQFDPDRWRHLDKDSTRFHYLPFGGGSRSCVGKEFANLFLKILTVELMRNCTWKLLNKNPVYRILPFPSPKDNLPVQFEAGDLFRRRAFTV